MSQVSKFAPLLPASAALIFSASLAVAENNSVFLLQTNPTNGAPGNTISITQELASSSSVGLQDAPVVQDGSGNSADITVQNDANAETLFAQGILAPSLDGNLSALGGQGIDALVGLTQTGNGNAANIVVNGLGAQGLVEQDGNGNLADLTVEGQGASGTLLQRGDNNDSTLSVQGATVTLIVEGNNLTNTVGPSVVSNGGTVIITQTQTN
ncbi:MAG: hypothetical protein AAFM92_08410 [Pseudomonadota bacterium]